MERGVDNSREAVKRALIDLVARKDASVFQNLDTFEQSMRKIGNWPLLPEIAALRAGLQQRLPWELQKAAVGTVPAKAMAAMAAGIEQNHKIDASLALWSVTSWATALNLKFEVPAPEPAAPTPQTASPASPSSAPVASNVPPASTVAEGDFSCPATRAGVVFGLAENGQIKVFKSWASPAPASETSGMAYTPVKIEERTATKLFTAAPKPKTKPTAPRPAVQKAPEQKPPEPPKKQASPTVPPAPSVAAKPSVPTPKPVMQPTQAPVSAPANQPPRVLNGSAEELFALGQSLMPGFSNRVNMAEALEYLSQSAKMGYIPAKRLIGEIHLKGLGVKTDCAVAAAWFQQAAAAGDAQAQFHLGTLYQCGMGVEFNIPMAQEWLSKAANQGHKEAREQLNQMLQA